MVARIVRRVVAASLVVGTWLGVAAAAHGAPGAARAMHQPDQSVDTQDSAPTERGDVAHNSVYVEVGGPSLLYSVSYERRLHSVAVRAGVGYMDLSDTLFDDYRVFSIPMSINFLGIGGEEHQAELGMGVTALVWLEEDLTVDVDQDQLGSVFHTTVGYRYHPLRGGWLFRVGLSALAGEGGVLPLPYLSFGGAF